MYCDRIDLSKEVDPAKSSKSKECMVCQYCFFNHGFKYQDSVCNSCNDFLVLCINISDIAIIAATVVDYRCIIHGITKSMCISKMYIKDSIIKNQIFDYYENLIRPEILQTKNILIDEKSYKDMVIYSTRYDRGESITKLNLYYHELTAKIEEHQGKKYLMIDDYVLDKVLYRIKVIINIVKFDCNKILTDTGNISVDNITLKIVILMTSVIKDGVKFYPQLLFEESIV